MRTVGDVLKKECRTGRSKVFGITLKDRKQRRADDREETRLWRFGSTATPATGLPVATIVQKLPSWLKKINDRRDVDAYIGKAWNLL